MPRVNRARSVENMWSAVNEDTLRLGWWFRYHHYGLITDDVGRRYVRADEARGVAEYSRPLSNRSADLFLRFARWPEDPGMDEDLDTERNAAAAKMWAETYGVLGLNPPDTQSLEENPLRRITAERLAPQGHVYVPSWRHSNSGLGGPPNESVENFALEAWDANTTLRLYEAINAPKRTGLETIREFMSTKEEHDLPGRSYMERKGHGRDYESACRWARQVVARGIESKVKGACFPAVENYEYVGDKDENGKDVYDKAKQGWGFDTLLGAMWLQMMWLVAEPPRLCRWCRKAVGGSRKDKKYCDDKCKGNWNYHIGGGKSGKKEKKRSRFSKDS